MLETAMEPKNKNDATDQGDCGVFCAVAERFLQHRVLRCDAPRINFNQPSRGPSVRPSVEDPELPWFRINWEIKALVPIACVLLGGMLLFLLATLSWRDPERHIVLLVAGAGAVAICGALLVVLTYTVQRPMVELQQKIAQLGGGDLSVSVSFCTP